MAIRLGDSPDKPYIRHMSIIRKHVIIAILLGSGIMGAACQEKVAVSDIQTIPPVSEADQKYAHVFDMLNGNWQGLFTVYEDPDGQGAGKSQPTDLNDATLSQMNLTVQTTITVMQQYSASSPYFQRVSIADQYRDSSGNPKTVLSEGVNKVQDGELWCVVKKPDELVIHSGLFEAPNTIIWSRHEKSPLRIEYFRETVEADRYTIIGWGYYGDDDPALTPRTWFWGDYKRIHTP